MELKKETTDSRDLLATFQSHRDEVSVGGDSYASDDESVVDEESSHNVVEGSPLGNKDTNDVTRWRVAVIAMLTFTAIVVLFSTYLFLSNAETDEFRSSVGSRRNKRVNLTFPLFFSSPRAQVRY